MIHLLAEESDFDLTLNTSEGLILVDFYASWCDPCKWLDQILVDIEPELSPLATIIKVDIENFPSIREKYDIRGIPVLMVIKNGEILWRMNGFLSGNELLAKIRSLSKH